MRVALPARLSVRVTWAREAAISGGSDIALIALPLREGRIAVDPGRAPRIGLPGRNLTLEPLV